LTEPTSEPAPPELTEPTSEPAPPELTEPASEPTPSVAEVSSPLPGQDGDFPEILDLQPQPKPDIELEPEELFAPEQQPTELAPGPAPEPEPQASADIQLTVADVLTAEGFDPDEEQSDDEQLPARTWREIFKKKPRGLAIAEGLLELHTATNGIPPDQDWANHLTNLEKLLIAKGQLQKGKHISKSYYYQVIQVLRDHPSPTAPS
jgi:hypothetical protein